MKMSSLLKAALLVSTLATTIVHADDISIGMPAYGGNGCPAGTASAVLSPDAKSLSLIFDQFIVEAGGGNRSLERNSCSYSTRLFSFCCQR